MANIYSLQLLRNGSIFPNYEAAVTAITGSTVQDGVIKLARYKGQSADSGNTKYSTDVVKTVFGIYAAMEGNSGWTLFDSYHEIIQNIQNQIDSLTGGAGSIAQQIEAALSQLNFTGVTGNVVTQVTETNGLVAATGANVGNLALTDYTEGSESGHVEASDSINAAIAKLQNQIDAANDAKNAAIEALDANITAENGSYIDHIEQVDGKISGTTKTLPSLAEVHEAGKPIIAVSEDKGQLAASAGTINAEYVSVADARELFSSSTVEATLAEIVDKYTAADAALKREIIGDASESGDTLGELEDRIEALASDAKEYSIKQITTGLSTNVKEAWGLFDTDDNQSGATINIYKDSAYKEIYLGTAADTINTTTGEITKQEGDKQSLNYAYMKADGTYDLVKVDVSAFLSESEFQSGVTAVDHIVRGVVDPASEKDADSNPFLTVGENGFKVDGIKHAIDAAVSGASDELQDAIDELSGKAVTNIAMTGGTAAITANTADGTKMITIDTDGSQILATGYVKGSDKSAIAASDSINAALAKLENQVDAAKATVNHDANNTHVTVTSATAADGSVTYTVVENDIASKTALDAEIAARKAVDGQTGQTYAANAGTNYISAATSLNDADVKLDTALKAVADSANSAQTEIDAIETAVGLNADGTHKVSTGNYTSGANSIESEIVALDGQVKTNTDAIDALEDAFVSGATMNGTAVAKANNTLAFTAAGKQTAATATNNEAIVVETDANGGLTLGIASLDAGTY